MAYIKLYEEFEVDDFSSGIFKEVDREEFLTWWINAKNNSKYKFSDKEEIKSVVKKVDEICRGIIGSGQIHHEYYESQDLSGDFIKNLGLISFIPDDNNKKKVFIRTSHNLGESDMEFGVIGFDFSETSKIKFHNELNVRIPSEGNFFICQNFDGLEDCLDELNDSGFFNQELKTPREPKPYKQQQVITDEDFSSRNIDNELRSKFYREYGRILKDISLDLPFEERRSKSLELLDNWFENLQ
jgi:hypothetical protein